MAGLLHFLTQRLNNRRAKACIAKAQTHVESGRFAAAIEACRQAVALRPDRPYYLDQLGHALTHHHAYWLNPDLSQRLVAGGQIDAAIEAWQKALSLGWTGHWTHLCLGHALTAKHDFSAAATHLRRATDLLIADRLPTYARSSDQGTAAGPDFIIIGGTKCGTTSLHEYMCNHPQVLPCVWKEIEGFRFPERGRDWYLAHFPRIADATPKFLTGEASTCYFAMSEVPRRVREAYPDVRLIAVVRDPVDKAISHCHHDRKLGCEKRTPDEALTRELDLLEALQRPWCEAEPYWRTERGYVWLGLYAYFLEDWLKHFPREQLLVVVSDDLYRDPAGTLATVFEHLGLPDHRQREYPVWLQGNYERKQSPIRDRLARFFAPHNKRLEALLGRELPWRRP